MSENQVDIDPAATAAGFEALAAEAGPVDAPAAAGPPASGVSWGVAAAGLAALFAHGIAPNWNITEAEQAAIAEPLANVLQAFFPALDVDPRWQAVGVLAMTVGAVAMQRVEGGKLRPLRQPAAPAKAAPEGGAGDSGTVLGMRLPPAA